ncbi:single-strand binding protein [Geoalkalibacter ferrihydriticus]|uniref:Single-stranded DNA-binding protein n=2 Tax=Geoalkalibacter ferrihydriticus TaxID=392333 RepID=A0A0C2HTR9_9BACT|nr:single-stranded DNA-binding protein [Geoalkalibacter ferrihydriticus]KIH76242.1 single-stranded DNA-binding protein [Geoalkalibacter ferrihydriticus DSM 17813]SDL25024.1 single-strand binding protein [Geoalkalibacter ferrihydriticus]
MSINKVILVGNLGKDPELRYTPSGVAVATFSLATSERYKDKSGEQQEKTEWHNIVAWRQLAEICGKYLHKGKQIYIEGKIQTRKYQDRDGNDRYITEIVADQMQMLGGRGDEGSSGGGGYGRQSSAAPRGDQRPAAGGGQKREPSRDDFEEPPFNPDDDIPF